MRRLLIAPVAAAALVAGSPSVPGPLPEIAMAAADEVKPALTKFTEFQVTPTEVDAADGLVRFSGRLVHLDADGAERPVAGVPLLLSYGVPEEELVTDSDGRFAGSVYVHHSSVSLHVRYQRTADSPYRNAVSPSVPVTVTGSAETRLSIRVTPGDKIFAQDTAQVSGKAEWRRVTGQWLPLKGHTVRVMCGTDGQSVRTALDGTYAIPFTVRRRCNFYVHYPSHEPQTLLSSTASARPTPEVHVRTRFADVEWPRAVERGKRILVTGYLYGNEDAGFSPVRGARVRLEFSPDGRRWKHAGDSPVSEESHFELSALAPGKGYWRIRILQVPSYCTSPGVLRSALIPVKDRTRFTGFNASPEPVRKGAAITVKGTLQRRTPAGVWKAFGKRAVTIEFRPKGSGTWRRLRTVKTNAKGRVLTRFKAVRDGYWRLSFAEAPLFFGSRSAADYVDVR